MTKVSVIIPIYNVEKYLRRCLNSIVNQTLSDIEIICINDGSTDNSLEILQEYAQKDERIVIINQQNEGVSRARNYGINIAKGEYIGFLDSDDYIDYNFYEKLYEAAKRTNAEIACASIYWNRYKDYMLKIKKEKLCKKPSSKYIAAALPACCYVWNKIYKTSKIKEHNCYFEPDIYYEDMPWTFRTVYLLNKMITVPNICYYYEYNPVSIVNKSTVKRRNDYIQSVNYIQNFVYEHNIKTAIKYWGGKQLKYHYIYLFGQKVLRIDEYKFAKCYYLFEKFLIAQIKNFSNTDLIVNPERDV